MPIIRYDDYLLKHHYAGIMSNYNVKFYVSYDKGGKNNVWYDR